MKNIIIGILLSLSLLSCARQETPKKILFVVTSHGEKGDTGEKTGYYLSEVAHPWEVLTEAGYTIDFVSPKGGPVPVDGFDLEDEVNKRFWEDKVYKQKIDNTMTPDQVDVKEYAAIYYAGGHGTMWDFPDNKKIASLAASIYENGGVVGAVCHGPAGLVNIKLSNGNYLVDGKNVTSFTDEEERIVKLEEVVPFLLETKLKERGASFSGGKPWTEHVIIDGRLVTGQNPQSAKKAGESILELLKN